MTKQEIAIKNMVIKHLNKFELPENFEDVAVDMYQTEYTREIHITCLFKVPFSAKDSDYMFNIMRGVVSYLDKLFTYDMFHISNSNSTIVSYNDKKWWYEEKKMITTTELKNNLNKSIKKISSLIIGSSLNINLIDIQIIDLDYDRDNNELVMVLIEIKCNVYSEPIFDDFIKTCEYVRNSFNDTLVKTAFDNYGNLKSPKSINNMGGIIFNGDSLISSINYSHKMDEVEFELDFMFS